MEDDKLGKAIRELTLTEECTFTAAQQKLDRKLDAEFQRLIALRDERLAKKARIEYINGKKYEWSPGSVADQRSSSISSSFAPTPNYYRTLRDWDNAECTPSVQHYNDLIISGWQTHGKAT